MDSSHSTPPAGGQTDFASRAAEIITAAAKLHAGRCPLTNLDRAGLQRALDIADLFERCGKKSRRALLILSAAYQEAPQLLDSLKAKLAGGGHEEINAAAHAIKGVLLQAGCVHAAEIAHRLQSIETLEPKEASSLLSELEAWCGFSMALAGAILQELKV